MGFLQGTPPAHAPYTFGCNTPLVKAFHTNTLLFFWFLLKRSISMWGEGQSLHSGEGLKPLPLGAACFLRHYNDTVCSAGRVLFQSAVSQSKQATSMVLVARTKRFIAADLHTGAEKQPGVLPKVFEYRMFDKRNRGRVSRSFGWSSNLSRSSPWQRLRGPNGEGPAPWHAKDGAASRPVGVCGITSPGTRACLSLRDFYLTERSGSTSSFLKLPCWGIHLILYAPPVTEFILQAWK